MIGRLAHIPTLCPSYRCYSLATNADDRPCRLAPGYDSSKPSEYMSTLTTYLSNIMGSVLLGLPTEIKELIYFDALSHAATMILVRALPLFWLLPFANCLMTGTASIT